MNVKLKVLLVSAYMMTTTLVSSQTGQSCSSYISESTPISDFIVNDDGTVTHTKTNLMWKICSEGMVWDNGACIGVASSSSWITALDKAETINTSSGYAGYSDWRVPNIKELSSIVETKCNKPSINISIFPITKTNYGYWSSSPERNINEGRAWRVEFDTGKVYMEPRSTQTYWLRLVRTNTN